MYEECRHYERKLCILLIQFSGIVYFGEWFSRILMVDTACASSRYDVGFFLEVNQSDQYLKTIADDYAVA
ncbi:hypothetical protein BDZ91DRAFT_494132 [Kalaharituber pfeilii]|nr:hypothetical protein BDZ91DRAFT_494132 [Kalaharituber pfeilii]